MTQLIDSSIQKVQIQRFSDLDSDSREDLLAVEEPLEIRISYSYGNQIGMKSISVTMRTPGNDKDLALGFLFTEGIIDSIDQVKSVSYSKVDCSNNKENIVVVELNEGVEPNLGTADRNFYTTSSCGVCGKGSIQSIKTVSKFQGMVPEIQSFGAKVLFDLPEKLRSAQDNFEVSGGIHASGIFTSDGELKFLREDVGRHNALDKLIGHALQEGLLPLNRFVLLLSGRASFELIQKAAMAGISIVAAIGAPSSLALELAKEFNITLIGFLKNNRFNIYNQNENIHIDGML
ncbi:formate dehydrogenase accessory sulfurtransferase FdhD [Sphingobacterium daejeonense]|uniref:formate dehydrogenase accessory sulfurtransferase FdhD n=1 Tax=Sphingobacterium daejeonense TaxID=371142 RepID=UPI0021A87D01|nr:formate dehydrogenase accessory sulfurtransferase FdhD [Sphingobacterium daejeonense]MCT1531589.1 formate dehydrogenase accessory sulfurtransferase FdhD [Sphingobacterium daejeonense]